MTKCSIVAFLLGAAFSLPALAQPLDLDTLLQQSSDLLQQGDTVGALALLQQHSSRHANSPEYLNNLAIAYLSNAQADNALELLRDLIDSHPVYGIIAHNLIELELQRTEAKPDTINPVLFVQSTASYFQPASRPESVASGVAEIAPIEPAGSNHSEALAAMASRITESWAAAWSRKDLDAYLGYYADDFTPNASTSHAQWRQGRARALDRPGEIQVTLDDIRVYPSADQIRVEFIQHYDSATYSDTVRKTLLYAHTGDRWRIISETSETTP
jgi:ketosteroid isomerase-like protein